MWVGLILALFLVVEAVTGLILAEPALFGVTKAQGPPAVEGQKAPNSEVTVTPQTEAQSKTQVTSPPQRQAPSGVFGVAKGLHQGRVGGMDLSWIVVLSGVGLAVLTATGVYLGIVVLRAGRRRA